MPQTQAYQRIIHETINNAYEHGAIDLQTILCQVLETLMDCERQLFLSTEPGKKGNGYYHRFIDHFQGRFEPQYIIYY